MSGGRPRVHVKRTLADYPPPTPQKTLCRLWQGAVDRDGYGIFTRRHHGTTKSKRVHRWIWEQRYGPIPEGLVVRHKCDNRVCYRLSHLELGTVADNNRDAQERQHLGPVRAMSPSEVREVWRRHEAGEPYHKIHADYPQYSLATIKRVKDYIAECLLLEQNTDSPSENHPSAATPSAAAASDVPTPTPATCANTTEPPTTPPSTTRGWC